GRCRRRESDAQPARRNENPNPRPARSDRASPGKSEPELLVCQAAIEASTRVQNAWLPHSVRKQPIAPAQTVLYHTGSYPHRRQDVSFNDDGSTELRADCDSSALRK